MDYITRQYEPITTAPNFSDLDAEMWFNTIEMPPVKTISEIIEYHIETTPFKEPTINLLAFFKLAIMSMVALVLAMLAIVIVTAPDSLNDYNLVWSGVLVILAGLMIWIIENATYFK